LGERENIEHLAQRVGGETAIYREKHQNAGKMGWGKAIAGKKIRGKKRGNWCAAGPTLLSETEPAYGWNKTKLKMGGGPFSVERGTAQQGFSQLCIIGNGMKNSRIKKKVTARGDGRKLLEGGGIRMEYGYSRPVEIEGKIGKKKYEEGEGEIRWDKGNTPDCHKK